jgi:hypothetical protein
MDTLLIQLTNQNAAGLLHELEELKLIKVLNKNVQPGQSLSQKYAGKLPAALADELQSHVEQGRQEWHRQAI